MSSGQFQDYGTWYYAGSEGAYLYQSVPPTGSPAMEIDIDVTTYGAYTINFTAPPSVPGTIAPNAYYSGLRESLTIRITNDSGIALHGFDLLLADRYSVSSPDLTNSTGHPDNYAHFHNVTSSTFPGLSVVLTAPDGSTPVSPATSGKAAANGVIATGTIAPGTTLVATGITLHQEEFPSTPGRINNDFSLTLVTPDVTTFELLGGGPGTQIVDPSAGAVFTFDVERWGSTVLPATVHYAVIGSGATPAPASDFPGGKYPSGTVSFAAGESAKTLSIQVNQHSAALGPENFKLVLSDPSIGLAGSNTPEETILAAATTAAVTLGPVSIPVTSVTGPGGAGYGYGSNQGQVGVTFLPDTSAQSLLLTYGVPQTVTLAGMHQNQDSDPGPSGAYSSNAKDEAGRSTYSLASNQPVYTGPDGSHSADAKGFYAASDGTNGAGSIRPDNTLATTNAFLDVPLSLSATETGQPSATLDFLAAMPRSAGPNPVGATGTVTLYHGYLADPDADYTLDLGARTITLANGDKLTVTINPNSLYDTQFTRSITASVLLTQVTQVPGLATVAVERFFDTSYGTHFFTADPTEIQTILATRPDLTPEGTGLAAVNPASNDPNAAPIYRFFDSLYGTHFFTADSAERDTIQATRPDLKFEGIGFYEHTTQGATDVPVYRFFDTAHGTHFYTADAAEDRTILATRADLTPEGIGFYSPS